MSSSSRLGQTARIRPLVFVWGSIKEAPVLWWDQQRLAMFQQRPKGWSANFRTLLGIMTWLCDGAAVMDADVYKD